MDFKEIQNKKIIYTRCMSSLSVTLVVVLTPQNSGLNFYYNTNMPYAISLEGNEIKPEILSYNLRDIVTSLWLEKNQKQYTQYRQQLFTFFVLLLIH